MACQYLLVFSLLLTISLCTVHHTEISYNKWLWSSLNRLKLRKFSISEGIPLRINFPAVTKSSNRPEEQSVRGIVPVRLPLCCGWIGDMVHLVLPKRWCSEIWYRASSMVGWNQKCLSWPIPMYRVIMEWLEKAIYFKKLSITQELELFKVTKSFMVTKYQYK